MDVQYFISAVGIVLIVTRSSIIEKLIKSWLPHSMGSFLSCPMCFGFWVGVFYGTLGIYESIVRGFSVSLLSYLVISVADTLHAYMDHTERIATQWDVDAAVEEAPDQK